VTMPVSQPSQRSFLHQSALFSFDYSQIWGWEEFDYHATAENGGIWLVNPWVEYCLSMEYART